MSSHARIDGEIEYVGGVMRDLIVNLNGVDGLEINFPTTIETSKRSSLEQQILVSNGTEVCLFRNNKLDEKFKTYGSFVSFSDIDGVTYALLGNRNSLSLHNINNLSEHKDIVLSGFNNLQNGFQSNFQNQVVIGDILLATHSNIGVIAVNLEKFYFSDTYMITANHSDIIWESSNTAIRMVSSLNDVYISSGNNVYFKSLSNDNSRKFEKIFSLPNIISSLFLTEDNQLYIGTTGGVIYCDDKLFFKTKDGGNIYKMQECFFQGQKVVLFNTLQNGSYGFVRFTEGNIEKTVSERGDIRDFYYKEGKVYTLSRDDLNLGSGDVLSLPFKKHGGRCFAINGGL